MLLFRQQDGEDTFSCWEGIHIPSSTFPEAVGLFSQLPAAETVVLVTSGGLEVIQAIAEDWTRLCDEVACDEPTYRPEWALSYVRAYAPTAKLVVLSAWSDERLRGILPLVLDRTRICGLPVRRLTCPANVHCLRFGLVRCSGQEGQAVLHSLWQKIKEIPDWDLIQLPYVVEGNGADQLVPLAAGDGFPVGRRLSWQSLYVPLSFQESSEPAWSTFIRPKFRQNLRRTRRQLEELGPVTVRHFDQAEPEALAHFYRLESSGWKGAQGTAIACDERTRKFYEEITQAAARNNYFSLDILESNGTPVSAFLGFKLHGRYLLAKAGYDEAYQRYGPGQLLVHEILNQSRSRSMHEFDFVGPATWDEGRWASARRQQYEIFIFRRGLYGSLLHTLRIAGRMALKKLLRRGANDDSVLEAPSPEISTTGSPNSDS